MGLLNSRDWETEASRGRGEVDDDDRLRAKTMFMGGERAGGRGVGKD